TDQQLSWAEPWAVSLDRAVELDAEAVLLEAECPEDFGAHGSKATGQVTNRHAEHSPHGCVACDADESSWPRHTTHASTWHVAGAEDEVRPILFDGCHETWKVLGRVGQVGVHKRQGVEGGSTFGERLGDARSQCGGDSAIALMSSDAQEGKSRRELRQPDVGSVAAAVVNRERHYVDARLVAYRIQPLEPRRDVVCLVVHGQHHGETQHWVNHNVTVGGAVLTTAPTLQASRAIVGAFGAPLASPFRAPGQREPSETVSRPQGGDHRRSDLRL